MRLRDISCNTICNRTEIWKNRSLNFSETDDNDIDKQQMATMSIVSRSKRMRLRHLFGPYSHKTVSYRSTWEWTQWSDTWFEPSLFSLSEWDHFSGSSVWRRPTRGKRSIAKIQQQSVIIILFFYYPLSTGQCLILYRMWISIAFVVSIQRKTCTT